MKNVTNWVALLDKMGAEVSEFAHGNISGKKFYRMAQLNGMGGEVKRLLETQKVVGARQLARKALKRRVK